MLLYLPRTEVLAATASASISVSASNTVIGNSGTATLTISSNEVIGQIFGTFTCGGLGEKDLTYVNSTGEAAKNKSYTINWKASAVGTYTCEVKSLEIGTLETLDWPSASAAPKTITVVQPSSTPNKPSGSGSSSSGGTTSDKKKYSSDNDLSSLGVDGYVLSPEFNKDTTEYKLAVDQSVEKINVTAKANHEKASVNGTGEVNLSSGENTIEVKVTAENGNEKVYKIIVMVEDQNPITVKIGDEAFTIVKKNNDLIEKLEHYEEEVIKIDEQDVIAYTNSMTKVTLVILKDKDNKVGYYIYNKVNNTYQEYRYIKVQGMILQLLDPSEVPEYYQRQSLTLQEQTINIYKIKKSHKIGLIYGTNIKTGNTDYYVYDESEETLSRYYDEEVKIYQEEVQNLKNYMMIFMGVVAFGIIVIIIVSLVRSKNKKKKRYGY